MQLAKQIAKLKDDYNRTHLRIIEDEDSNKERTSCEYSLHTFMKYAWHTILGEEPFIDGWHLKAICLHLEMTVTGEIKYLIINIPPGCCKSILLVMFNAWIWTKDPSKRFMQLSYAQNLSIEHNDLFRKIISSSWYLKHWGNKFVLTEDSKTKLKNNKHGSRLCTSVESKTVTGFHCHYMILDDPNSAMDVESKTIREGVNNWYSQTTPSRLLKDGVRIIVQQRLHMNEITGYILDKKLDNVVQLKLPMEYKSDRACKTIKINGKVWEDPRKKEDELLWPQFKTPEYIRNLKKELSEYVWEGQYQQEPYPISGGIFKRSAFNFYDKPDMPTLECVISSWDTALTVGEESCYSACTHWGIFIDDKDVANVLLLDTFKAKVNTRELLGVARNLAYDYYNNEVGAPFKKTIRKADIVIIENKVNGIGLYEDLYRSGVPVHAFNPKGAKEWRALRAANLVESGKVWLPAKGPDTLYNFADEFREAAVSFPNNKDGTDLVDTMSQAMIFIMDNSDVMPKSFLEHRKYLEREHLI